MREAEKSAAAFKRDDALRPSNGQVRLGQTTHFSGLQAHVGAAHLLLFPRRRTDMLEWIQRYNNGARMTASNDV